MMSETTIYDFEPIEGEQVSDNQSQRSNDAQSMQEQPIYSKDYQDIQFLTASRFGASRVYLAKNGAKKVIIKALKHEFANDPRSKAALRKEYELTSQLDHKYIRKALDLTTIQGLGECVIFEYVEGNSLAEHVRVGTLSEKQIKSVLIEVCDALSYMHRNQIIHCDLKPENIIVTTPDCRTKIIDIGLPDTEYKTDKELLIKEMEFVAPELIKGEDCDARSDVYSMGKIMEFINERNISRQYQNIATHCTQFSKEQRFDSIAEVKSGITKGYSLFRIIVAALVIIAVGCALVYFIPKVRANAEKEKQERMAKEFAHEIENIKAQSDALCEKYRLTSLTDPVSVNWSADSMAYYEKLKPYFGIEGMEATATDALMEQKMKIEKRRQADFEALLLSSFQNANDSLANALKTALPEPTDSLMMIEAYKWLGHQH